MPVQTKDCGWSWVVLAAVCIGQMLALGQVLCFGIFFVELLEEFQCTRQEAVLVGSLAFGVKCFTAAPASVAQTKYGCRIVVMTGGIVAAMGFFASYFATQIWHLYLTYGIFVGFGFGCTFVPSFGAIPDYFEKYRFFATAFAPVGSALGTCIFSPFYYYLVDTYSWRGAMMILAGLSLHITVCGAVMRSKNKDKNLNWSNSIETSLFNDTKFYLILLEAMCFGGTNFTVFSMANSLAIKSGLTKGESTQVASTMGLCNFLGRVVSAMISVSTGLNRSAVFATSTLLCAVGALVSVVCTNWWTLAIAFGLYGLSFGAKVSQLGPVIIELFGIARMVNAMGYYMFLVGISTILGTWVAGLLAEETGVENAYWLAGALSLVAAGVCFVIVVWHSWSEMKKEKLKGEKTAVSGQYDEPESNAVLMKESGVDGGEADGDSAPTESDQSRSECVKCYATGAIEMTPRRGWRPAILSFGET